VIVSINDIASIDQNEVLMHLVPKLAECPKYPGTNSALSKLYDEFHKEIGEPYTNAREWNFGCSWAYQYVAGSPERKVELQKLLDKVVFQLVEATKSWVEAGTPAL